MGIACRNISFSLHNNLGLMKSKTNVRVLFFIAFVSVLPTFSTTLRGQSASEEDALFIRQIYDKALTEGETYQWLHHLTKDVGARLSGSPQAAAAVEYTRQMLDTIGLDSVWLQPCMVPHWVRGGKEVVRIARSPMGTVSLNALAFGGSVGTGPAGISAEVVEVKAFEELEELGKDAIEGKIVFYNRAFDATLLNTFQAYGGAVGQRVKGAIEAAKYGAVATLVRSMASGLNDVPHTGSMFYEDGVKKIPSAAISTNDAELLSSLLQLGPVDVYIRTTSETYPDKRSYNVIGEIRGWEKPDEIIVIGGHLDSWDTGEGAHDDGAGCVQSMEVLRLMKRLGYRPKRTIRCVLFMNEENGSRGGKKYAEEAERKGEAHLAAIESDRGGFTPRGFTFDGSSAEFEQKFGAVQAWLPLLRPYYLHLKKGGGGADISHLKSLGTLLIGFEPDSQRYFDYHHTPADVFEAVNERELELGAAAITSLVFLIDKYGLE
jgi:carboxypeptidase Q